MTIERVVCIVLDGCGAGAAPDAALFGDEGENSGNTLFNIWNTVGGINAPNLASIGLFAAAGIQNTKPQHGVFGRLQEISIGKDTITGHWEMMGIVLEKPLPTYPKGFPIPLIQKFEKRIGKQTIGNVAASGTEIISRLGATHMETGCPIVYTSADSVFQIATHEEIIPIEELYEMCRIARELLVEPNNVGRVIARPFRGSPSEGFTRTDKRRDFPLVPAHNIADTISQEKGEIFGIGIIPEVFAFRGFRKVKRTQTNEEHQRLMLQALESDAKFIWANFEDFDMLYGHRNDTVGFAKAIERFDKQLEQILSALKATDLLILTADHGNDPTTPSTDHSREYVPICLWTSTLQKTHHLEDKVGFWHVGHTVANALKIQGHWGASLLSSISS
jgi:phosphopentomutase